MSLDTRGLASGFAQGFGLADQYYARQAQGERADERMAMERERFGMQREEIQRARDLEDLQFTMGKIANGMEVTEDEVELLRRYPKYWPALDEQTDQSLMTAMEVIDPQSPVGLNDPEALAALNQMFGAEINKGDGGQKRVVGMVPGPDGESVMLDLEVIGEDGQAYTAPMTEGRAPGSDEDLVMQVPVEKLVEQVQGMRSLRQAFQGPEAQAQASRVLGLLRGDTDQWEQIEGPDGAILQRNRRTGETKRVLGRKSRGSSYYHRPTSMQNDAQWMVDNGIAPDLATAFEMLKATRGKGTEYGRGQDEMDYLGDRISEIQSLREDRVRWARMDEADRAALEQELDDLAQRRDALAEQLYRPVGLAARDTAQPDAQEPPAAPETEQPAAREQGRHPGPPAPDDSTDPDALLDRILGR